MNNTEPLPFYKEPLYYTGLITAIGTGLGIYSIIGNNNLQNLMVPSVVTALIFGAATYFMWNTRCPHCKRPFSKKEDLGIKKEPFTYYSKVYKYSDGTSENVPGSQKTIIRDRKYDRHYYLCKKCNYGLDKEWKEEKGQWLGETPKVEYINKKVNASESGSYKEKNLNKKERVPIKKSLKRELFNRAENACQHCGHSFGLDIHHIDENPSNNSKTNLIVLCANCHRMVGGITKIALKNEAVKPYKKSKTINIYK